MTLTFTDISSNNGNIDLSTIKTDGLIVKLTGGKGYTNTYWTKVNEWLKLGKPAGIYHYINNDGSTPQQQADHFLSVAGSLIGKVPMMIDYESNSDKVYNALLLGTGYLKQMLDYITQKTGVKPFVYTYADAINAQQDFSAIANADYPLWVAAYQEAKPTVKYWKLIAMWQNQGAPLDHSIFYGDLNAWNKYANPSGKTVNPTPQPAKPATFANTFVDSLGVTWHRQNGTYTLQQATYLRWGATTKSTKIALLSIGQIIKYDAYCYSGGFVWIRQSRGNNFAYLATGKATNNARLNYWGKFN